jgi:lysozyme
MRRALLLAVFLGACAPSSVEVAKLEELRVCHTEVVEGIDVASYQGTIDWNMVHASGREFAIARIGDGTGLDSTFATNWAGIRAAGMVRGAYLFFRPTSDVQTQADHVAAAVGVLGDGDLPVTIDVECMCPYSTPGHTCELGGAGCATAAEAAAALDEIVMRVEAATGKRPMIYTSARVWDGATYYMSQASQPMSALWVPAYTSTSCPAVASSWTDWQFWQYSDGTCSGCVGGVVPGVGSGASVDRDRWNGTIDTLRAFASGSGVIGTDAGVDAAIADAGADASTADAFVPDAFVASDGGPGVSVLRPDGGAVHTLSSGGCGCHVGADGSRGGIAMFALGLALAVSRRRAPRRTTRAARARGASARAS